MVIAVIRIRGVSGIKPQIRTTMNLLRIRKAHHCMLAKEENITLKGMLYVCKDYVAWGNVSKETLRALIEKRGRLPGDKRVPADLVEKVALAIENGEKETGIKPVFRLSPPRKGFKTVKAAYPKGALGPRGDAMNDLLKSMM